MLRPRISERLGGMHFHNEAYSTWWVQSCSGMHVAIQVRGKMLIKERDYLIGRHRTPQWTIGFPFKSVRKTGDGSGLIVIQPPPTKGLGVVLARVVMTNDPTSLVQRRFHLR